MRAFPDGTVFTTADAAELGWTMSGLKNAVRRGHVLRIRRGVYATTAEPTTRIRILAAARAHPDCPVSDRSALILHDLPLLGPPPNLAELTVPPRSNANMPGVHVYRAQVRELDTVMMDGALVMSEARTLVDVARHRPTATAVAAIDAGLHRGSTTLEEIADVLAFCQAWTGASRARRAVGLADARAESPLESISRLVIPQLGLPAPDPQTEFLDRHGHLVGRGDFYWDEVGVVGEADGRSKYDERPVLTAEKDRQEELEDLGLVAVRWGWRHATRDRQVLRTKLAHGFDRGRRRDASGFPRLWTPRATPRVPKSGTAARTGSPSCRRDGRRAAERP